MGTRAASDDSNSLRSALCSDTGTLTVTLTASSNKTYTAMHTQRPPKSARGTLLPLRKSMDAQQFLGSLSSAM